MKEIKGIAYYSHIIILALTNPLLDMVIRIDEPIIIKMETKNIIRKGTKVKIVSSTIKSYIDKVGIIFEKRIGWFGKTEYLIDVPFIEKQVWLSRDDLYVVNAKTRARNKILKTARILN